MPATGSRTSSSLTVGSPWSKRSRPRRPGRCRRGGCGRGSGDPRRPRPPSKSSSSSSFGFGAAVVVAVVRCGRRGCRCGRRGRGPGCRRRGWRCGRLPPSPVAGRGRLPPSRLPVAVAAARRSPVRGCRCGRCRRGRRLRRSPPVAVAAAAGASVRGCRCGRRGRGCAAGGRPRCRSPSAGASPVSGRRRAAALAAAASADGEPAGRLAPRRVRGGRALGADGAGRVGRAVQRAAVGAAADRGLERRRPRRPGRGRPTGAAGRAVGWSAGRPPGRTPPTWRAEMAATRSPLRIRPVPEMPSSPARRCSSGSSIPDRPLPRRRALPVVPEAAGASLVPAASCAPVSTRSVVSLTYRSFPAVTCAFQRRGCPGPLRSGPEAGTQKGTGRKNARRISGEERSSASAPREARPSGRLRREPRRSSRTGQHRWVPACSSLPRRYLRRPDQHLCPGRIDLERRASSTPAGVNRASGDRPRRRPAGRRAPARWGRRRRRRRRARRRAAGRPAPSDSGIAGGPLALVQPVVGGLEQQGRVAGQRVHEQRGPGGVERRRRRAAPTSGSSPRATCGGQRRRRARGRRADVRRDVEPDGAAHRRRSSRTASPRRAGTARRCRGAPRARWSAGAPRRRRSPSTSGHSAQAPRTPATTAAAEEPIPRPCGMPLSATTRRPGGVQPSCVAGGPEGADDQVRLVGGQLARADAGDRHLQARRRGRRTSRTS